MLHNCCQSIDGKCPQCGEACALNVRRLCTKGPKADKAHKPRTAPEPKSRRAPCDWLGQPTSEVALAKCQTCRGNVRRKKTLYDCALFGRCLPWGHGETAIQQCAGCPRYSATATQDTQPS